MMFSQFLDQESTVALQVFILSFGLIGLTLTANSLWAAGGAWLMRAFATEKALRVQGYLFGSMLAAVGVWMFYGSGYFNLRGTLYKFLNSKLNVILPNMNLRRRIFCAVPIVRLCPFGRC